MMKDDKCIPQDILAALIDAVLTAELMAESRQINANGLAERELHKSRADHYRDLRKRALDAAYDMPILIDNEVAEEAENALSHMRARITQLESDLRICRGELGEMRHCFFGNSGDLGR